MAAHPTVCRVRVPTAADVEDCKVELDLSFELGPGQVRVLPFDEALELYGTECVDGIFCVEVLDPQSTALEDLQTNYDGEVLPPPQQQTLEADPHTFFLRFESLPSRPDLLDKVRGYFDLRTRTRVSPAEADGFVAVTHLTNDPVDLSQAPEGSPPVDVRVRLTPFYTTVEAAEGVITEFNLAGRLLRCACEPYVEAPPRPTPTVCVLGVPSQALGSEITASISLQFDIPSKVVGRREEKAGACFVVELESDEDADILLEDPTLEFDFSGGERLNLLIQDLRGGRSSPAPKRTNTFVAPGGRIAPSKPDSRPTTPLYPRLSQEGLGASPAPSSTASSVMGSPVPNRSDMHRVYYTFPEPLDASLAEKVRLRLSMNNEGADFENMIFSSNAKIRPAFIRAEVRADLKNLLQKETMIPELGKLIKVDSKTLPRSVAVVSVPPGVGEDEIRRGLADLIPRIEKEKTKCEIQLGDSIARIMSLDPVLVDQLLNASTLRLSGVECPIVPAALLIVIDQVGEDITSDAITKWLDSQSKVTGESVVAHISMEKLPDKVSRVFVFITDRDLHSKLLKDGTQHFAGFHVVFRERAEVKVWCQLYDHGKGSGVPFEPQSEEIKRKLNELSIFQTNEIQHAWRAPNDHSRAVLWLREDVPEEKKKAYYIIEGSEILRVFDRDNVDASHFNFGQASFDDDWYTDAHLLQLEPLLTLQNATPDMKRRWDAGRWLSRYNEIQRLDPDDDVAGFRHVSRSDQTGNEGKQEADDGLGDGRKALQQAMRRTVMISTIGAVLSNRYELPDETFVEIPRPGAPLLLKDPMARVLDKPLGNHRCQVDVEEQDCLVAAKRMQEDYPNLRPLVLNMASAERPGGGYLFGEGAQEEDIFRRSSYYQSLDPNLNDSTQCDEKGVRLYPLHKFSAIVSKQVQVFRGPARDGYKFLDDPFKVDLVAVAARDMSHAHPDKPEVVDGRLVAKRAAEARRRIQTIFAAALQCGYDSLVLSAFGCGQYGTPPRHMAEIFLAVIQEFAGAFKRIVFAILDEPRSSGNLEAFRDVLESYRTIKPKRGALHETLRWSYALPTSKGISEEVGMEDSSSSSDSFMPRLPKKICSDGESCSQLGLGRLHELKFAHPPFCPEMDMCDLIDVNSEEGSKHRELWRHRKKCPDGGLCQRGRDQSTDEDHKQLFRHPRYCSSGGRCEATDVEHLKQFFHVDECQDGPKCSLRHDKDHAQQFRHVTPPCECSKFWDREHQAEYKHPYLPPCPSFCPSVGDCTNTGVSHVCNWGMQCNKRGDSHHERHFVHVERQLCKYQQQSSSGNCELLDDEHHLSLYSHREVPDIRLPCADGTHCERQHDRRHISEFAHGSQVPTSPVERYNEDIDFYQNQKRLLESVNRHSPGGRFKDVPDLREWILKLRPVHRCSLEIFESVALSGHLMSRCHMEGLKDERQCSEELLTHPVVAKLLRSLSGPGLELFGKLMEAIVHTIYEGNAINDSKTVKHYRMSAAYGRSTAEVDKFVQLVEEVATSHRDFDLKGIGHPADPEMGTNRQVFAILGPHNNHTYGAIGLIFNQSILSHPDVSITPQAGTSYRTNRWEHGTWVNLRRGNESGLPPQQPLDDARQAFDETKLSASINGWELPLCGDRILATELKAGTGHPGREANSLRDIIDDWVAVNSHSVFECHLPKLVPLSCVEKIVIPVDLWKALKSKPLVMDRLHDTFGGKDRLKEMIVKVASTEGADLKAQSNGDHKVNREIEREIRKHVSAERPLSRHQRGYRFALDKSLDHTVRMPGTLPKNGHLYFTAVGGKSLRFAVAFSKGPDIFDDEKDVVSVHVRDSKLSLGNQIPMWVANSPQTPHLQVEHEFNKGLYPGLPIAFHMYIEDDTLIVEHAAPSCFYNGLRVTSFKLGFVPKYIHVAADKRKVDFSGFVISNARIPELDGAVSSSSGVGSSSAASSGQASPPSTAGGASLFGTLSAIGSAIGSVLGATAAGPATAQQVCPEGVLCTIPFRTGAAKDDHMSNFDHSFWDDICPDFEECADLHGDDGCPCSHPCRYGKSCREKRDPSHARKWLHDMDRPDCPAGKRCFSNSFEHRTTLHHPHMFDFPIRCQHAPCRELTGKRDRRENFHKNKFCHED